MMLIGCGTGVAVGVTVEVTVGSGVELAVGVKVSGGVVWVGPVAGAIGLAAAHPEAITAKMTRMRNVFFMNTPLELRKPVRLNPYHPTRSPIWPHILEVFHFKGYNKNERGGHELDVLRNLGVGFKTVGKEVADRRQGSYDV
jgi:hypothetical protein